MCVTSLGWAYEIYVKGDASVRDSLNKKWKSEWFSERVSELVNEWVNELVSQWVC
jgi:KaiC/GvpD/RAD55 family RecA-like ATPase